MQFRPSLEPLEPRALTTLVFLFNGNAFAAADPGRVTQNAAATLARDGDFAIQMSTPAMDSRGGFVQLSNQIRRMSRGQPIGLIGFRTGGAGALRLAEAPGLNVKAVFLNFYGPPDLQAWLQQHRGDIAYRYVATRVRLDLRCHRPR